MYIKKILVIIALLVAIGMGVFSYYIYKTLMSPNTAFEEDYELLYIRNDDRYQDVLEKLEPLLLDLKKFDVAAQQKQYAQNVKGGRYMIQKGMNNNDIISALRSQNLPVSVIFNNQDRLERLAGRISHQIEADSAELVNAMKDTAFLRANNFDPETALNMYIPNKYEFYWNTSAAGFRDKMKNEYKRFWNEDRRNRAEELGLTQNEVQNLAAIVQKETAKVDERKRVAGVYMNRIIKGWKLEADPTVIHAIKTQNGGYDTTTIKRVLYKDLEIDSPYNTYMYEGIPPGPIAMSDISSIDAVLYYENHDFFFFVADPKRPGYHNFSKTLAQHIRYKNEYVNWINKMKINR